MKQNRVATAATMAATLAGTAWAQAPSGAKAAEASLTESAPAKRAVPGVDHAGMRGMPGGLDSCADMMRGSR